VLAFDDFNEFVAYLKDRAYAGDISTYGVSATPARKATDLWRENAPTRADKFPNEALTR